MGDNDGGNDADWTNTAAGYFQPNDQRNLTAEQRQLMGVYNQAIADQKVAIARHGALSRQAIAATKAAGKALDNLSAAGFDNSGKIQGRTTGRDRRRGGGSGKGGSEGGDGGGSALNPLYP